METLPQEILTRIDSLAEKLGTTAGQVYATLTKWYATNASTSLWTAAVFFVFITIIATTTTIIGIRKAKTEDSDWYIMSIISVVLWVIATLCIGAFSSDFLVMFQCPEGAALKEVLRMLQ